jgi:hypothetical protein
MGRLRTAGSVTELRRALFPEGFAGEVMLLTATLDSKSELPQCFAMR